MQHRVLFLLLAGTAIILSACSGASTVVFNNTTECGTIQVELTNSQTGTAEVHDVPPGETITIEIAPNITYAYVVDYTAAGVNDDGYECIAIHRGQVMVPAGSAQHFNLTASTPTPPAP